MAWLRSSVLWFDSRRRTIALVLVGWVALMVVAAGRSSDNGEWVAVPDLSWLLAAALGLSALIGLITLVVVRPSMKQAVGERKRISIRALLFTTAVIAAIALVLDGQDVLEETPANSATPDVELNGLDTADDAATGTTVNEGDLALLVLLAGLAAAVLVWSRSRSSPVPAVPTTPEPAIEPEIIAAVNDATELLLHGDDPRESVIAAYATLEHALASEGRSRHQSETPTEHLRRVLQSFPMLTDPAIELGRLYELARFSDATISVADQRDAAEALGQARRDLASPGSPVR
jgi:hypothetical protein